MALFFHFFIGQANGDFLLKRFHVSNDDEKYSKLFSTQNAKTGELAPKYLLIQHHF